MSETTAGIDKLIARIRADAVEYGQGEREKIIAAAHKEAAAITAKAENEGSAVVTRAHEEARKLNEQMQAELRLAARDFTTGLSQRLRAQVIDPAIRDEVKAQLADAAVLAKVIGDAVGALATDGDVEVVVGEAQTELLAGAAWQRITEQATNTLQLTGEAGLAGFRLQCNDQHVVWDFSDAAVAAELARFVSPALRKHFADTTTAQTATNSSI